jgi:hypothetical protein
VCGSDHIRNALLVEKIPSAGGFVWRIHAAIIRSFQFDPVSISSNFGTDLAPIPAMMSAHVIPEPSTYALTLHGRATIFLAARWKRQTK